jgi:Tfp pilus assembly protein PilN
MKINLLPPEVGQRQQVRRRTLLTVVIGVVILALVGGFYFLQVIRLSSVEDDLAAQEQVNSGLRSEIAALQDVTSLEAEIEQTKALVDSLLADQVLWSGVLRDISLVIPGEAWLNGLTASTGAALAPEEGVAPTATQTGAEAGALIGQISFNGFAFDHREVALWLSRLEDVRGFVNPWLATSAKTEIGGTTVVSFTSSVDMSSQALAQQSGGNGGGGA